MVTDLQIHSEKSGTRFNHSSHDQLGFKSTAKAWKDTGETTQCFSRLVARCQQIGQLLKPLHVITETHMRLYGDDVMSD